MTSLPPDSDFTTPAQARSPLGLDALPPELEGIQRDLLADAADWGRGVPSPERFNQRLRAVLPADEPGAGTRSAPRATSTQTLDEIASDPRPRLARGRPPRPSRLSTALALVATVAVVALLAAVVATLRPHGAASGPTTTRATATPTLPVPGPITPLPLRATYAQQPGIPVIAANNPKVIYEYSDSTGSPVLRRSDDGGAGWHALAYPTAPGTFVSNLALAVNPADAANVFLEVALGYHPGEAGTCRQANPGDKSVVCIGEYASTDYGAHWLPMRYPVPGTLFPNGMTFNYDGGLIQAQGSRVYGALQYHNTQVEPASEVRILSSTDGGATWQLADGALAQQGLHICDFAAAPTGATLFARTAAVCQGQGVTARQLWRSDDAGAHWRQVTPFAAPFNSLYNTLTVASAASSGGSDQVIVYEGVPDPQTFVMSYYASLDGGASWQPAPTAGLPVGAQGLLASAQTLRDGSLVVAFDTGASSGGSPASLSGPTPTPSPTADVQASNDAITCYAWNPGLARWLPLTQPVATGGLSPTNLYVADGAQRAVVLTLQGGMPGAPTYTIERFE